MKTGKSVGLCLVLSFFLWGAFLSPASATGADPGKALPLTRAEEDFIRMHPVIHLGVDPAFVPFEFIDTDGTYKGIAADYISLISEKTGLQMIVAEGLTWSEAYEKAVRKELDVLPCVGETPERGKYFLFSDTYFTFQRAVFINEDTGGVKMFQDLYGKTAAVQTNSSHHSYMKAYPEIALSLYPTVEQALQAVSSGTETAFIGNLATSSYLAKSMGIANLKYFAIDPIAADPSQSLHFAVRNDWPELIGILNKALDSITTEEKNAIANKWIDLEGNVDYSDIIRTVEIAVIVIALILAVSFFWILRLRKEIAMRKKAQEEMLAAKEEAELANQVKSLFLARMSHEIRTPLNAILGMAHLIKRTDVTVTQSIYLDKLTQAARNMLGTINDILDFSKIEAGKIEIERIPFDLDKVLQRIINIASVKVEEQGIELVMEKDPGLPSFYFGDPLRIEQILLNLVNNAVKFTEKGSVSISVRSNSKTGTVEMIELCVRDTGIGMNPQQLEHLFIPFDQGDSSISRRFGGSGLGLSIVKSLTELMGGDIFVSSEAGSGSAFTVRLPLEIDTKQESESRKEMAADCFRGIHALILDANENSRTQLAGLFDSFGISADLSASAQDALQRIRDAAGEGGDPYNLLVVDFSTPTEGGIEFMKDIRNLSLLPPSAKYIMILPITREDLFEELEQAGIDFGITKPIIPSVLYNGIIEIYEINPPEGRQKAGKSQDPVTDYPYSLLLVEDNTTNQFIAKSILEQAGFRVSTASNGQEGYQFFADNRDSIDLILMDLHMPVMDGYTASGLIRELDAEVPIVAMTADAIAGVQEQCRAHGMNNYVSKPFEPEQLIETILSMVKPRFEAASAPEQPKPVIPEEQPLAGVLDMESGIRRIGGDKNIYRLILQEFLKENRMVGLEMKKAIDAGEYAQAAQIAHKIKSSAGSIGAESMREAAAELQKALQETRQGGILAWQDRFRSILEQLLTEIEKIVEGQMP